MCDHTLKKHFYFKVWHRWRCLNLWINVLFAKKKDVTLMMCTIINFHSYIEYCKLIEFYLYLKNYSPKYFVQKIFFVIKSYYLNLKEKKEKICIFRAPIDLKISTWSLICRKQHFSFQKVWFKHATSLFVSDSFTIERGAGRMLVVSTYKCTKAEGECFMHQRPH